MVLAVVAGHPHVHDGVAEVSSLDHRLLNALFHRRYELAGDGAPDDGVDELEALSALERFDAYPVFTALGDSIEIGPTGNNLRDLRILLAY